MTIHSQVRHKHSFLSPVVPWRGITDGFLTDLQNTCYTKQNARVVQNRTCHTKTRIIRNGICVTKNRTHVSHRTHVKHRGFRLLLFCFDYIVLQITNIYICFHMKKGINNSEKLQSEYDTTTIQRRIQWPEVGLTTSNGRGRPECHLELILTYEDLTLGVFK